jgi:hypothetical protein
MFGRRPGFPDAQLQACLAATAFAVQFFASFNFFVGHMGFPPLGLGLFIAELVVFVNSAGTVASRPLPSGGRWRKKEP